MNPQRSLAEASDIPHEPDIRTRRLESHKARWGDSVAQLPPGCVYELELVRRH